MSEINEKAIWDDGEVLMYMYIGIFRPLYLQVALDDEILQMSTDEIISRTKLLENEIKVVIMSCPSLFNTSISITNLPLFSGHYSEVLLLLDYEK